MNEQLQASWSNLILKLSGWLDSLVISLPNFLIALVVFILAYRLARKLQGWTNTYLSRVIEQASIRGLAASIVSAVTIILGLLFALSILNLDGALKSLLAGAGVAGLAISLALQGTLSNIFSGVFIVVKNDLNVGDWIETNGYSGQVINIDLRNTKLKESDNNIVVVPNKLILENPFKNYGLTKTIRTTINCGVAYESDLEQVKKIAIQTIEALFPPRAGEKVEFYYKSFGESAIDFSLRFWVDGTENLTAMEVKSEAIMAIKEVFAKNKINIPYPTRTLISQEYR